MRLLAEKSNSFFACQDLDDFVQPRCLHFSRISFPNGLGPLVRAIRSWRLPVGEIDLGRKAFFWQQSERTARAIILLRSRASPPTLVGAEAFRRVMTISTMRTP